MAAVVAEAAHTAAVGAGVTAGPTGGAAGTNPAFKGTALYVGDLDRTVDEQKLFAIFNTVAPVTTIRICRHNLTRESLGYAYVNFQTYDGAQEAMKQLNYTSIEGRPCRIMWSQRDPSLRRSNVGNVFVKNLDAKVTSKDLHTTFNMFGSIQSCKVALDERGVSKGYGFVHFESQDAADQAIATVNGMEIEGRVLVVEPYQPRQSRAGVEYTNLYVKNLPAEWDEAKLKEEFGKHGEITSSILRVDAESASKKHLGFGFVNFATHAQAVAAEKALNGKEIAGTPVSVKPGADAASPAGGAAASAGSLKLYVGRAMRKAERDRQKKERAEQAKRDLQAKSAGCNLYVRNLDESVDDDKLRKEFETFGTITSARIMRDDKGRSKLFGFVCFAAPAEAERALAAKRGKLLAGKPLYVTHHLTKEQRVQQIAARATQPRSSSAPAATGAAAASAAPAVPAATNQLAQQQQMMLMMMAMFSNPQMQGLAQAMMRGEPAAYAMVQQIMGFYMAQYQQNAAAAAQQQQAQRAVAAAGRGFPAQGQQFAQAAAGGRGARGAKQQGAAAGGARGAPAATGAPGARGPAAGARGPAPVAAAPSPARGPVPGTAAAVVLNGRAGVAGAPYSGGAAAAGGMRFDTNVRNAAPAVPTPEQQAAFAAVAQAATAAVPAPTAAVVPAAPVVPAAGGSLATMLANASEADRQRIVGERLYSLIAQRPTVAKERYGKITGMLLAGMDVTELIALLESPEELDERIAEAQLVLNEAGSGAQ